MGATGLFVALVDIGAGALACLVLLTLAAFGWQWVPVERLFSRTALVPLVSVVYRPAIVADRVADSVYERWWCRGSGAPRSRR
jgi:hypothetical protein